MNRDRLIPLPLIAALLLALLISASGRPARADVKTRAASEAAEYVIKKFGAKVGQSAPALARRIEIFAARYGDDAVIALRKAGPKAFGLIESAGKNGGKAARVLALHGEAGATRILARPKAMSQFVRFGDQAAHVLVKHPGVAEGLLARSGAPAIKALAGVTPRNGRRLAMLVEGELAKTGSHPELLGVIARYGDRAAEFVWRNKGALAVGTALTAFLANPEPFLDGARSLAVEAIDKVAQPIVREAAASVNWTLIVTILLALFAAAGGLIAAKFGLLKKPHLEAERRS